MNVDIFFNILLHCDIVTIQSFSCVKSISQYFWIKKFEHDNLILIKKMNKTIDWIREYKKVKVVNTIVDENINKLLVNSLKDILYNGIFLYITPPHQLLSILPEKIHINTISKYEQKVSVTLKNNIITLYYKIFRPHIEKSMVITMDIMHDLLWKIYYYHELSDIETHIS